MNINEEEFEKFVDEIKNVGKTYGIPEDVMTSIIADAIKNREDTLGNSQKGEEQKESIKDVVEIYGIPKVEFKEQFQDIRVIYGIPKDMEQMFSEKVDMKKKKIRTSNSYTPMTDEEIEKSREKLL